MAAMIVLVMVATILLIEWLRRSRAELTEKSIAPEAISHDSISLDEGVFYSPGHTWAALGHGGSMSVGIDSFLRKLMDGVDEVYLPEMGSKILKGQKFFEVSKSGKRLSVTSPVSGIVRAVNTDLQESPVLVDSVEHGWVARVQPEDIAGDLSGMTIGERARTWMSEEIGRLRDFFSGIVSQPALAGQTLMDGGMPVAGVLTQLDDESLSRFQEEFLKIR